MSVESASAEQLRALVAEGERLSLAGQYDEAILLLLEALESPRFADFREFPEYAAAEHMASGALLRTGSLLSARRYLERAIARGPESPYYGPSVRRLHDVALLLFDMAKAADWLGGAEAAHARTRSPSCCTCARARTTTRARTRRRAAAARAASARRAASTATRSTCSA